MSGRRSSLSLSRSQPSSEKPDVFGICLLLSHLSLSLQRTLPLSRVLLRTTRGVLFVDDDDANASLIVDDGERKRPAPSPCPTGRYAHRITIYVPGHRDLRPSATYITSVCDRGYPCQFQRVCHRHLEYLDFSRKNSPILLIESD